ncbi:MAG TPA: hypothetical protein VIF83_00405 [Gemmatimonadaceae bacterium]|jgi:hypothetical protein
MQIHRGWIAPAAAAALILTACATGGTTTDTGQPAPGGQTGETSVQPWAVKSREHVDLWLHGFAMLQADTALVPYFRRGYVSEMQALRNRSNVTTQLDANRDRLRSRLTLNDRLVNAQFVPFYFDTFDEMSRAVDLLIRSGGNPRAAGDQQTATLIALMAGYFPTTADQDWVRLFIQSLRDEDSRFYRSYWDQQQRERAAVLNAVSDLWQLTYRPKLQTFLNNTRQVGGEIFLSLPLDGEGRTVSESNRENATAVTFPARTADAVQSIYVIAHELVGQIVATAVRDNTTPSDTRAGLTDQYIAAGAVRGGAILLQKVAPELVDGYTRYYLQSANRPSGTLATVFRLPDGIIQAISRQIDTVLGGI